MTLIIGIKCQDGIVLGADSAATTATPDGSFSIKQNTAEKLKVLNHRVVIGTAGPVGLGQSFAAALEKIACASGGGIPWKNIEDAKTDIREATWEKAKPIWEQVVAISQFKQMRNFSEASTDMLVAFPIKDEAHLLNFSEKCVPEEIVATLPFVSIGCGQKAADTFWTLLRRLWFPNRPPTIAEGILTAIWTLNYAIHAEPFGLAHPVQIVTLSQNDDKSKWSAKFLDESALEEHHTLIQEAEQLIKDVPSRVMGRIIDEGAPSPPSPPAGA